MSIRRASLGALVAAVAISAALASGSSAQSKKTFVIGWVPPTVAPFETAMRQGIKNQAKALGMKVDVAGGLFNPSTQITAVTTLVNQHVNAILIWPLDLKSIQPALDQAIAAHIPVFVIDSAGAKGYTSNFATDDYGVGIKIAAYVAQKLGGGSKCAVGIIQGPPVVPILAARNDGLAAGAKKAGCTILDQQVNPDDSANSGRTIASAWKTKYGSQMTAILTGSDPWAMGALSTFDSSFHPLISGYNGDTDFVAQMKQGNTAATASLQSPEIGNAMAYAAYQVLNGHKVPKQIHVPYQLLTQDNVASYKPYAARLKGALKVKFVTKNHSTTLVTSIK